MGPDVRVLDAAALRVGLEVEFERDFDEADVLAFAENSGDRNPLHVDSEYARGSNYERRITHGAFQVGLASRMVGMHLPGRDVLLNSITARFPHPLYFPARVRVHGRLRSWNAASRF